MHADHATRELCCTKKENKKGILQDFWFDPVTTRFCSAGRTYVTLESFPMQMEGQAHVGNTPTPNPK